MAGGFSTTATSQAGAGTTWQVWTSADSNTSTSTDAIWGGWTNNTTTTTNATPIWSIWANQAFGGQQLDQELNQQFFRQPAPTPEEVRASREALEASRLREIERQRDRAEAESKAKKLLVDNLTKEQKKSYEERGVIPVRVKSGNVYEIHRGRAGNIRRIVNGRAVDSYCIHPSDLIPDEDTMLTQLLWLRWCEEDFLKIANRLCSAA